MAIIMDGNGRWARTRNLPRIAGHRAGVDVVKEVLEAAGDLGIRYLSLFAFSTENWSRPADEVDALMNLLVGYVDRNLEEMKRRSVRLIPIGDIDGMPPRVRDRIKKAEAATAGNDRLNLVLAVNYGGRADILQAVAALARDAAAGEIDARSITAEALSTRLYTADIPDPDLIIRTSGEVRLSNFYLWQAAYSELWITDVYWPDFNQELLRQAVTDYRSRERRFGRVPGEGES